MVVGYPLLAVNGCLEGITFEFVHLQAVGKTGKIRVYVGGYECHRKKKINPGREQIPINAY